MRYALLIYENDVNYAGEGARPMMQKHVDFNAELGPTITGGAGLKPVATATTVRTAAGKQTIHDGPFAETKEQLGGFYLIDVGDLDAAIAVARKLPIMNDGSVEIRPLLEM